MFIDNLAHLVRVCGSAVVGVVSDDVVEHDSVRFGADGFVLDALVREPCLAVLAVLSELFEAGPPCTLLVPPKAHPIILRVRLHALLHAVILVLFRLIPAEVSDLALEILVAFFPALTVGLADGLEWPLIGVVAVEALDAVTVGIAGVVLLETDAHLLTVARFALTGDRTATARIQVRF